MFSNTSLVQRLLALLFISSLVASFVSAQLDASLVSVNRRSGHRGHAAAKRMVMARRALSSSSSDSSSPSTPAAVARADTSTNSTSSLPKGWWETHACVTDSPAPNRILPDGMSYGSTMTPAECVAACDHDGYTHAGVQNGQECWCGTSIRVNGTEHDFLGWDQKIGAAEDVVVPGAAQAGLNADVSKCNLPCLGDGSQMCGGWWHMTLYWKHDDCVEEEQGFKNWKGWAEIKNGKGWKEWLQRLGQDVGRNSNIDWKNYHF